MSPLAIPSSVIRDTVAEQEIDVFDKRLAFLSKTATDSDNVFVLDSFVATLRHASRMAE